MDGDQVAFFQGPAQQPGALAGHILVGGAVEAVAADAVLFIQFIGQGIEKGLGRHGLVKGRIKDRHLGHLGEKLPGHPDAVQVGRIMQGRQGHIGRKSPG